MTLNLQGGLVEM